MSDGRIRLRCPKCRGQTMQVIATHTEETGYDVEDGQIVATYNVGTLTEVLSRRAMCLTGTCRYRWRVRGEDWADIPTNGS